MHESGIAIALIPLTHCVNNTETSNPMGFDQIDDQIWVLDYISK